ncbi:polysaccharide deacetylase family protein [Ovoidimarina sediminis]|uniref:polysaccharide deacetylase family protein n=1 Tax=Ovoidimarina sediminis TaxID=3079856 RepID=UPI0029116066|nr:polysaccharide deacetylase family protein [Rhodophyticola sp. MJ-SS7]MDU8944708.1 polysaccharide deacetylase family protein [Rhodophyticola sp. MJ-SS7]
MCLCNEPVQDVLHTLRIPVSPLTAEIAQTNEPAMHLICLHNVVPGPIDAFDEKCSRISVAEFEAFLDRVSEQFELISYSVYETLLREGEAASRALALSFDDGFRGVYDYVLPVLRERNLDAVAFINPPVIGNPPGTLFHFLELEIAFRITDQQEAAFSFLDAPLYFASEKARVKAMKSVKKHLKAIPEIDRAAGHAEVLERLRVGRGAIHAYAAGRSSFQTMTEDELRDLRSAGWTIGSHGMSHRTLSMLPADELDHEIEMARAYFADTFGWHDLPFAYPYGDIVHVGEAAPARVAAAGHPIAYTTVPGPSDIGTNPHRLPRIDYKRFLREEGILLG